MAREYTQKALRYCTRCRTSYDLGERFCPLDGATVVDAAQAGDPLIGKTLAGRYLLIRVVGKGGMGVVYEAEHVGLGKRLAVKLLLDTYSEDREVLARFHMEARNASRIGHENIIDIVDIGDHEGRSFIAMELLEGVNLRELCQHGALPVERALAILEQILWALGAAHAKGIIHRDMKPENVFLTERGGRRDFVKLMDFGISKIKAARESQVRLTQTGEVVGTPLYMAPEQALGKTDIDHRVDIYSVGVMMYELFTGKPPFEAATYLGLLTQHVHERPTPPRHVRPDLAPILEKVILRALEKEPERRYASVEELAAALPRPTPVSVPMTVVAGQSGGMMRALTPAHPASTAMPTRVTPAPARRFGLIAGLSALGVAAIVGVIVLALQGGGGGETPRPPTTAAVAAPSTDPLLVPIGTKGTVELKSEPAGARVWLDGADVGVTPLSLPDVPFGEHRIRLELAGYVSIEVAKVTRADVAETFVMTPAPAGKRAGGKTETGPRVEPRVEPPKADPPKADPPKSDPPKADPPKVEKKPPRDDDEPPNPYLEDKKNPYLD